MKEWMWKYLKKLKKLKKHKSEVIFPVPRLFISSVGVTGINSRETIFVLKDQSGICDLLAF